MNQILLGTEGAVKAVTENLLRGWMRRDDEAWLSESTDVGELERRMRSLEQQPSLDAQMRLEYMRYARH